MWLYGCFCGRFVSFRRFCPDCKYNVVQAHDILMGKMDLEGSENEEEFDEVCAYRSMCVLVRRGLYVVVFYLPRGVRVVCCVAARNGVFRRVWGYEAMR